MRLTRWSAVLAALCVAPLLGQQATFKSGVNMLALDVLVVDRNGEPVLGLQPDDFTVTINNRARRVTSADLVRYETMPPPLQHLPAARSIRTPGFVGDDSRVFVLAIDDSSFLPGAIRPALAAAERFIDNLRPSDMVGVYVFPFDRPRIDITHDHPAVKSALRHLVGRRERAMGQFHLTASEIVDITANDGDTFERVVSRECNIRAVSLRDETCPDQVRAEAGSLGAMYENEAAQRLYGLGIAMQDLGLLPGRKTLVLLSGGLMSSNRSGGRPAIGGFMGRLGEQAARSNVTTYVLHADDAFLEAFSSAIGPSPNPADRFRTLMDDEAAFASGLERLAAEASGAYFAIKAGSGDLAFGRILRETMAYYLLGVEPTPADWDGRKLLVRVTSRAKGTTVRALKEVIAR